MKAAFAARSWCSRVPPWKIGAIAAAPKPQKPVPDENTLSMDSAVLPASAVSVMFGSRFAVAMPTCALAAWRLASAWGTSGQHRQQITQLRLLLDQRRQRGGDLRELRFLRHHVQPAGVAFGILIL